MKKIMIDLIASKGIGAGEYYDSAVTGEESTELSLCTERLCDFFDIHEEEITLVISDKPVKNSYFVQFKMFDKNFTRHVHYIEFLDIKETNQPDEYIFAQTFNFIRDRHPELLTNPFYISILE